MVELSAVNRSVVGSSPTCGAIFMESCPSGRRSTIGNRVDGHNLSQGFKSLALRHNLFHGPLVKRLRHRPFTAVTRVRIPYGSYKKLLTILSAAFWFLQNNLVFSPRCLLESSLADISYLFSHAPSINSSSSTISSQKPFPQKYLIQSYPRKKWINFMCKSYLFAIWK